jgi:DNA-binding MarR family transcriptional regulator
VSVDPARDVLDAESRATGDDHDALRVWLRLLATTHGIEALVRGRLQARFGITLARFDYLAQLERSPQGLRMRELSERLMVTGGNVTGLTDALEAEGHVVREADPDDRRAFRVRLTPAGRRVFRAMASEHERWIVEIFAQMAPRDVARLRDLLGQVKQQVRSIGGARPIAGARP